MITVSVPKVITMCHFRHRNRDHDRSAALMGATTARGRDVVRPRLPHRLLRQRPVGGAMGVGYHASWRGDGQLVARRQRAPYRSTFMTYFRRSESGAFDLRHQHPKRERVLVCRECVERSRMGGSAIAISGADEHQASVHLQMSTEPGQRLW